MEQGSLLIYSSMIFLGLTLWDILIAALTTGFRNFLKIGTLRFISIISGVSLIGFGLYFHYTSTHHILGKRLKEDHTDKRNVPLSTDKPNFLIAT